jgi:sec-independent protein translocase protein TatA
MNIFGLGTPEILVIVFLLLLFFGKDKLPDLARSIGKSFRELKDGITAGASSEEKPSKSDKKS